MPSNRNHNQHHTSQFTIASTYQQLRQRGLSRSQIRNQFDHVTKRFYAPLEARSPEATEAQRFTDFHNIPPLHHSMLQRIGFYTQENPNALLGGFSALALHGLTYWVNAAPLTVVTDYPCPRSAPGVTPLVREFDPAPPIRLFDLPAGPVHAVSIEHALVSALKDVLRGRCTWRALPILPLSPVDVRAIQLIDAVGSVSADDLFSSARGRLDARRLSRLFRLSDAH